MASERGASGSSSRRITLSPFGSSPPTTASQLEPVELEDDIANEFEEMDMEMEDEMPKRKQTSKRSMVWKYFTSFTDKNGKTRARCIYCKKDYASDPSQNGTSGLNNHLKNYKKNPQNPKNQTGENTNTVDSYCQSVTGLGDEATLEWKYEYEVVREAVGHMIIVDELPFKHVEGEGFRAMMRAACPLFTVPSRSTITRDCYKMYFDGKSKLKAFFKSRQRVSLTTAWTSNQQLSYLCLTAHFIDENWELRKYILNSIPCPTHKGEEVGLLIEKCLLDWGIDKVFTITVDNASSNDTTVAYLRRRFINWGTAICGGKYLHMRCVAHIVNLVVRDWLKDLNASIERIRNVVKYVRQSPMRIKKFENFVEEEKVESKKTLCLDVPTRWDSVYKMLDTALAFQGVFDRYEVSDANIRADFGPRGCVPYCKTGLPTALDWEAIRRLVKVLLHFYKLTLRVSGSLYVTSNIFLEEIGDVDYMLKLWIESEDKELTTMATQMTATFDKYCGNIEKMNMMLYVAVILDPRHKFKYVKHVFKKMYGDEEGEKMGSLTKKALYDAFEEYKNMYATSGQSSSCLSSPSVVSTITDKFLESDRDDEERLRAYKRQTMMEMGDSDDVDESEVDTYLRERMEKKTLDFKIIEWWKVHSSRFPVLSRLARDVLAMPISAVASESAFSAGGRIISDFRASLTPRMAQSLICCQDWIRQTPITLKADDEEKELESLRRIEI